MAAFPIDTDFLNDVEQRKILLGRRAPSEPVPVSPPEHLAHIIETFQTARAEKLATLNSSKTYRSIKDLAPLASQPWVPKRILNQGQTGHCVGFSIAGWGIAP